jgi:hypothetical protein
MSIEKISQNLTTTNYKIANGTDLIELFEPYTNGPQANPTNYKVLYDPNMPSIDLNTIFAPYVSGFKATVTNYLSNGNDLNTIFAPLLKYTTTGNPTITFGTVNGVSYNNIIIFNSSGSITFLVNTTVNYFLVGGGGTGGFGKRSGSTSTIFYGGGGGAGQVKTMTSTSFTETYTVTIGSSTTQSSIISPSSSLISLAGGNGANGSNGPENSGNGGSSGNGFIGGNQITENTNYQDTSAGGGGGGSTGNGGNATNPGGTQFGPVYFGVGGTGTVLNINGVSKTYGIGGDGGGFNGWGTPGAANTGNGGQGNTQLNVNTPVAGGSGIAILYFN